VAQICVQHPFSGRTDPHHTVLKYKYTFQHGLQCSDDSVYQKYRYFVFDIDQIFRYITISFIYCNIFDVLQYFMPNIYIFNFFLPHCKIMTISKENDKLTKAN